MSIYHNCFIFSHIPHNTQPSSLSENERLKTVTWIHIVINWTISHDSRIQIGANPLQTDTSSLFPLKFKTRRCFVSLPSVCIIQYSHEHICCPPCFRSTCISTHKHLSFSLVIVKQITCLLHIPTSRHPKRYIKCWRCPRTFSVIQSSAFQSKIKLLTRCRRTQARNHFQRHTKYCIGTAPGTSKGGGALSYVFVTAFLRITSSDKLRSRSIHDN